MNDTDKDVARLKAYVRSKGYRLGSGKVFDAVSRTLFEDGHDEELKMLNKIMSDPRQSAALLGLMLDDLSGGKRKAPRRKVRRGVGSY